MYGIRKQNKIDTSIQFEMKNLLSVLKENRLLNEDCVNPIFALYDLTVGLLNLIECKRDEAFEFQLFQEELKNEVSFLQDLMFYDEGELFESGKKKFLLLCMECDLQNRESLKLLKLNKYNLSLM